MKRFYRLLCFLLALVMLVSCTNGGNVSEETTEAPDAALEEDSGTLIVRRGIPQYSIVYASNLVSECVDLVERVQETIKEYTNATLAVKEETETRDENAKEILIGTTQYEESKAVKKDLEKDEYVIRAVGNKIVVTAYHNDALLEALYYIIDVMISKNTALVQGKPTLTHEDYSGKYVEPEEIQFNGVPITEFSVVYSTEVPEMEAVATDLAKRIGNVFKTTIDCYSDEKSERRHEILVGMTNRWLSAEVFADAQVPLMSYKMVVSGDTVQMACPGAFSGAEMLTAFNTTYLLGLHYRNMRDGTYMEKNLLKRTEQPLTEGSTLRIMTSNILADRWVSGRNYGSVAKRAEMYAGVLMVYRPSLVGVQETDDPWTKNLPYYLDYLREYLYMDYEWIENTYPYVHGQATQVGAIPNMTSIIYSKDQFIYEESGMQEFSDFNHTAYKLRVLTWGIFTHKASGEKYALVNTHYDGNPTIGAREIREQAAKVNAIKNKYAGIRVFCTGDYNNHGGYNINDLKTALNMLTTKDIAKTSGTLVNEIPGIPEKIYIDHIFTEKTNVVTRHETIDDDYANVLSDHRLQYADIIVK